MLIAIASADEKFGLQLTSLLEDGGHRVDPKSSSAETVALLDAGADDAIARPFQPPIFLAHMLKHPGRAFKRDELLAAVWNFPGNIETRTLDKHVESLRRKVGRCAELIQTVHGVGYPCPTRRRGGA